jgi:hypothetical protein
MIPPHTIPLLPEELAAFRRSLQPYYDMPLTDERVAELAFRLLDLAVFLVEYAQRRPSV